MKIQSKPLQVLERTSHFIKEGVIRSSPSWYNVVAANPPTKNLVRLPTFKYQNASQKQVNEVLETCGLDKETSLNSTSDLMAYNKESQLYKTRVKKSSKDVYQPIKLRFLEDELRNLFYLQHPWELADAKVLIENREITAADFDWSSIIQLGKKLDGESVVQRTLYILKDNKKQAKLNSEIPRLGLKDAYDQARFEYYQVKMARELEVQAAHEEAAFYGAVYKKGDIEKAFENEETVLAKWRVDGMNATKAFNASRSGNSSSGVPEESTTTEETNEANSAASG